MRKLPINFALYVVSTGLALGSGALFYETVQQPPPKTNDQILDDVSAALERGRGRTPDDRRDDYTEASKTWWKQFQTANFIGYVPPPPPPPSAHEKPVAAPPQRVKPIKDILQLVAILYDGIGEGKDSKCVVRYRQDANVQVPPDVVGGGYSGPSDVGGPPPRQQMGRQNPQGRGRPGNRPNPGAQMPTYAAGQDIYQHLQVGDALWPPYGQIVLARIAEDASSAVFERKAANLPEGTPHEETIVKNELDLDPALIEELRSNSIRIPAALRVGTEGSGPQATATPVADHAWKDVPETKMVAPNEWQVSRADNSYLQDNAQQVLEDVGLRPYRSQTTKTAGLQITHLTPELQRFGIQEGDVLLELNGVPVQSKAEAVKVGREQYRSGTRTFTAKVLNRFGTIEERTYHVPES